MSTRIGVRELKIGASSVLRAVRERGAEYVVTYHGRPVAILRPLTEEEEARLHGARVDDALADIDALAASIAEAWSGDATAAEAVAEQRRG